MAVVVATWHRVEEEEEEEEEEKKKLPKKRFKAPLTSQKLNTTLFRLTSRKLQHCSSTATWDGWE
jgi:CO dehydrogenase/acetyl-CoA synthase beta subunit